MHVEYARPKELSESATSVESSSRGAMEPSDVRMGISGSPKLPWRPLACSCASSRLVAVIRSSAKIDVPRPISHDGTIGSLTLRCRTSSGWSTRICSSSSATDEPMLPTCTDMGRRDCVACRKRPAPAASNLLLEPTDCVDFMMRAASMRLAGDCGGDNSREAAALVPPPPLWFENMSACISIDGSDLLANTALAAVAARSSPLERGGGNTVEGVRACGLGAVVLRIGGRGRSWNASSVSESEVSSRSEMERGEGIRWWRVVTPPLPLDDRGWLPRGDTMAATCVVAALSSGSGLRSGDGGLGVGRRVRMALLAASLRRATLFTGATTTRCGCAAELLLLVVLVLVVLVVLVVVLVLVLVLVVA